MAFFFGDSFDLYTLPADALLGYWDSGTTGFLLGTGRFSNSRAIVGSGNGAWLVKSSGSNDAVHHIVCSYSQSAAVSGSTLGLYFQLSDGATNQVCIVFRQDGAILLTSATPGGTVLATYTGAVTASNTWYAFEIEVVINNTTGSFAVRKNGNTSNDFSATSLNTRPGANNYANKFTIAQNTAFGGNTCFDDVLWRSDTATVPWVGDVRCYTRMPATDASVQWTRSSTTINYSPYTGSTNASGAGINLARYTSFVSQGGTIGAVTVVTGATGTISIKCAIFADTSGQPGVVIQSATAAIANPPTGSNVFTFSPAVAIPAGTRFWVGVIPDANLGGLWGEAAAAPGLTAGFSGTGVAYASWPQSNPVSLSALPATNVLPSVTALLNANWVAELRQDGATSYVYSSTVGQADLYGIGSIGSTPTTILGVVTRGLLQKSDAGTRNVTVNLKSSATTVSSASTALNTTWGWVYRNDLVDPNTSAAWTPTAVNNAQIGATVTA